MLHACEILFSESVRARFLAQPNKAKGLVGFVNRAFPSKIRLVLGTVLSDILWSLGGWHLALALAVSFHLFYYVVSPSTLPTPESLRDALLVVYDR